MPSVSKKRKVSEINGDAPKQKTSKTTIDQVRKLEQEASGKQGDLNKVTELLEHAESEEAAIRHAAIHSLQRVFIPLVESGKTARMKEETSDDSAAVVASWMRSKYHAFQTCLIRLLSHDELGLQTSALSILMLLVKAESAYIASQAHTEPFATSFFRRFFEAFIALENGGDLRREFIEHYLNKFDDVRLYTLKAIKVSADELLKAPSAQKKDSIFGLLEGLRNMPAEQESIGTFLTDDTNDIRKIHSLKTHRKAFSEAWVAALKLPMNIEQLKRILLMLHKRVIPHMVQPNVLMDFLTDAYDAGGAMSLLALNGVFSLLIEHNLEYPDFYKKLYALFDRDVMHVKYRSRFFRLVDIFLSSTHLPAQLVASFIKRMCRLSLVSPPSAIVTVIPLIYNLLKNHPGCMVLIHRTDVMSAEEDPFDMSESDPMLTKAIDSSIWELATMQDHYHPSVSTLAKVLSQPFSKQAYLLEDFLDHTYTSMFDAEVTRRIKKDPAVVFVPEGEKIGGLFDAEDDSIFLYK